MKKIEAILTIISILIPSVIIAESKALPALLVSIQGKSIVYRDSSTIKLSASDVRGFLFNEKDAISVVNGFIMIQIGSSSLCRFNKGSLIIMKQLIAKVKEENVNIFIKKGSGYFKVKKKYRNRGTLKIGTVTTVASVRGTSFIIDSFKDSSGILVDKGRLEIKRIKDNKTLFCQAGNQVVVKKDEIIENILSADQKERFKIFKQFNLMEKIIFDALIKQLKMNEDSLKKFDKK